MQWVIFHEMLLAFINAMVSSTPNKQQSLWTVNKKEIRMTSTSNKGNSVPGCQILSCSKATCLQFVCFGTSNLPLIQNISIALSTSFPCRQTPVFLSHSPLFPLDVLLTQWWLNSRPVYVQAPGLENAWWYNLLGVHHDCVLQSDGHWES